MFNLNFLCLFYCNILYLQIFYYLYKNLSNSTMLYYQHKNIDTVVMKIIYYLLSWTFCYFKCIWMYSSTCSWAYVSNIKGVMKYENLRVPNFKSIFVAWGGPTFTTFTIEQRKYCLIPTYRYYLESTMIGVYDLSIYFLNNNSVS